MWEVKEDRGMYEKRERVSGWCRTGWARVVGGGGVKLAAVPGCELKCIFLSFFFFFLYIFPSSEPW